MNSEKVESWHGIIMTLRDIMKIDKNISSIVTLIDNKLQ